MDLSDDCFQLNYNLLINWSVCKMPERVISVFPTARGDLFCLFYWIGSPQPKEIQTSNPDIWESVAGKYLAYLLVHFLSFN